MLIGLLPFGYFGPSRNSFFWEGLLITLAVVGASGCVHHSIEAEKLLRDAGQVICDAKTFEATGTAQYPYALSSGPLSWTLGPQGEYRIAWGNHILLSNKNYYACKISSETGGNDNKWEMCHWGRGLDDGISEYPHVREDRRLSLPLLGFHGLFDTVLARMRVLGKGWLDDYLEKGTIISLAGHATMEGHSCTRVQISFSGHSLLYRPCFEIWIDDEVKVVRKTRGEEGYDVTYKTIRLNQPLPPGIFEVPPGAVIQTQPGDISSD